MCERVGLQVMVGMEGGEGGADLRGETSMALASEEEEGEEPACCSEEVSSPSSLLALECWG